jgi:hypothetical protein
VRSPVGGWEGAADRQNGLAVSPRAMQAIPAKHRPSSYYLAMVGLDRLSGLHNHEP